MSSSVVLPTPFGPTSATRSPRPIRIEKSRDDRAPAEPLRDCVGLDHQLPRQRPALERQPRRPGRADLRPPLGAQLGEPPHPAHVALAPRRDALDRPAALGPDEAVELVPRRVLLLEDLVAPLLEAGEALLQPPHLAAVDPQRAVGQRLQERPVVADHHEGRPRRGEMRLEPGDRRRRRDGWSARRAASAPAPRRSASPAPPAAARRPRPAPAPASGRASARPSPPPPATPRRRRAPARQRPRASRRPRGPGPAPCSRRPPPAARTARRASASTSPAISRSSVDLPDPLRPTSAIRSPGWIASATSSKRAAPPKPRRMSASVRIGGSAMPRAVRCGGPARQAPPTCLARP